MHPHPHTHTFAFTPNFQWRKGNGVEAKATAMAMPSRVRIHRLPKASPFPFLLYFAFTSIITSSFPCASSFLLSHLDTHHSLLFSFPLISSSSSAAAAAWNLESMATPPTPYHLQSPRTILTKIISMKQPEPKIILEPRHRTTPAMWCAAIVCFAFSVLVILVGLIILIVYLAVKPKTPSFDVANAALNSIYIASPSAYFNGDMTLVANISNPNHKIGVVIQSGAVELFFRGRLVSAQALPSFAQRREQFTALNVHMLSSQVVLPPEVAMELVNQMKSNKILYTIRGTFKVREKFLSWHYTYRMTAICDLELTAPPSGFLLDRRCTTSK